MKFCQVIKLNEQVKKSFRVGTNSNPLYRYIGLNFKMSHHSLSLQKETNN